MEDLRYISAPRQLETLTEKTSEVQFSMASEPLVGALLRTLAASKPGGNFLELGTGTGVATAWLLDGMDVGSTLTSVEIDTNVQQITADVLVGDLRLSLVTSDALEFLKDQVPRSFDLVFADSLPGKYEGLSEALSVVKRGGFYVIDDMLPQPNWPDGHAAKVPVLMEQLVGNKDFEVLPIVWASGVVVAVRKV